MTTRKKTAKRTKTAKNTARRAAAPAAKPLAHKLASAKPIMVKPARRRKPSASARPSARPAQAANGKAGAKKPVRTKASFRPRDFIVYPGHGVGRVKEVEILEVGGLRAEVFVLTFPNMMLVRVPVSNAVKVGMRELADRKTLRLAMRTLRGRARIKRTMWSRRAQEYEAKINSGNLVAIAEVVRDLYRDASQPEQSYSERQLYEQARARMVQEVALVRKQTEDATTAYLEDVLSRAAGLTSAPAAVAAPPAAALPMPAARLRNGTARAGA